MTKISFFPAQAEAIDTENSLITVAASLADSSGGGGGGPGMKPHWAILRRSEPLQLQTPPLHSSLSPFTCHTYSPWTECCRDQYVTILNQKTTPNKQPTHLPEGNLIPFPVNHPDLSTGPLHFLDLHIFFLSSENQTIIMEVNGCSFSDTRAEKWKQIHLVFDRRKGKTPNMSNVIRRWAGWERKVHSLSLSLCIAGARVRTALRYLLFKRAEVTGVRSQRKVP